MKILNLNSPIRYACLCILSLMGMSICEAFTPPPVSVGFVVVNTADSGTGSLRRAILDSNASGGGLGSVHKISFNIPGIGPFTIQPLTDLPAVSVPTWIDGYSQLGSVKNTDPLISNAVPLIVINGSNYTVGDGSTTGNGLLFVTGSGGDVNMGQGSVVDGLILNEWALAGLQIQDSENFIAAGNFIGTDATGTLQKANQSAIYFNPQVTDANFATVGLSSDLDPANRNVLGGSFEYIGNIGGCVFILFSNNSTIMGNLIGVDKTGTKLLGNSSAGIFVADSDSLQVGGTLDPRQRNIVSGQTLEGISLNSFTTNAIVSGNYIGTDVTGNVAIGNGTVGIEVRNRTLNSTQFNTVANNVISGNRVGVIIGDRFPGVKNNTVVGNFIGTNAAGTAALGNKEEGIILMGKFNIIGGDVNGRNIISGNGKAGILITENAHENQVIGNYIGLNRNGKKAIPNHNGIQLGLDKSPANSNSIGLPGQGNVISGNKGHGILIQSRSKRNVIQNNVIGCTPDGTRTIANDKGNIRIQCSSTNVFSNNIECP